MTDSIAQVFWIVLPVFGLIGLGYLAARTGYLSEAVGDGLNAFVLGVAIPVLLFRALATVHFPEVSPWPIWISYFGGLAAIWFAGDLMLRKLFGRDAKAGIIAGVSASYSNAVLLGIPLVVTAFGEEGIAPLLLIVAVHLPTMMVATTLLIAWAERRDGANGMRIDHGQIARTIASNIFRNPMIIGILAGSAWRLAGLGYSGAPKVIGDHIALAAIPCALFALGMSLTKYGIRGNVAPAILMAALKLAAMPALVWLIATKAFAMPPLWVAVITLVAACPTGVNAWLLANQFKTGHAISANTTTLGAAASVITLAAWLVFLGA